MRYEIRVLSQSGEVLCFPNYGENELICVTRVATVQSWSSPEVEVYDNGELVLQFIDGQRTRALGWEVQLESRLSMPFGRPRDTLLYDDESWRDTWRRNEERENEHPSRYNGC